MSAGYSAAWDALQNELETMRTEVETLKSALRAVEGGGPMTLPALYVDAVLEAHRLRRRAATCPHCSRPPVIDPL